MPDVRIQRPADWRERHKAVDISNSCIVQAPAGSGKTELLVQRLLALLAVAEKPEEILSITFTRKAAGEMRQRLLNALLDAAEKPAPAEGYAHETWSRARKVLERDAEKGWNLLQNPARLQLMTIDSLCAYLTRRMPWMSRFGEHPGVTDDPDELYRKAAESLLSRMDAGLPGHDAIEILLEHLDNRLALLRDLLVVMIGKRDQWLRHLLKHKQENPRELLEGSLALYVTSFLEQLHRSIGGGRYHELRELAVYAAGNLADGSVSSDSALLTQNEDPGSLAQWLEMLEMVLTAAGSVRKSLNRNNGFPADKTPRAMEMKSRAMPLLEELQNDETVSALLQSVRKLPATVYKDKQWRVLEALIELLPLAVLELREVFRARGVVDFIEIAGAAHAALGDESDPEELLLQLDSRINHILVDEFQDTSYAQYDLLCRLTAGWSPGDGRSLFVVGDPMQSIYRFREAEVGLYLHVCQHGLNGLPMEHIVLNTNFRSSKNVVGWVNSSFAPIFPVSGDVLSGAVPFSEAVAFDRSEAPSRVSLCAFLGRQDKQEARVVAELVRAARQEGSVAVLVRSRGHLEELVRNLKHVGITYQAQDIDPLADRPVVQDLLSLLRALYRPADRISWLAVLRAPWCGLTLHDLAAICGSDSKSTIRELLTRDAPQEELFDLLSEDGRSRLDRTMSALAKALENIGRLSMRALVESAWLRLGGPACYADDELQDAEQVFNLLGGLDKGASLDDVETQLGKLFASPAPLVEPDVNLMTIHKAKGLEFDTVILPGLGRGVRGDDRTLLRWLEHPQYELLLAPIPPLLSDEKEATYEAIGHIQKTRTELETARLLYVATTRAKSNLHLLGHVSEDSQGEIAPLAGSLLALLWPVCRDDFMHNLMIESQESITETSSQQIRRLPAGWCLPSIPASLHIDTAKTQVASGRHYADEGIHSRLSEEGRIVGTIVHDHLERIAREGLDKWSRERLAAGTGAFKNTLGLGGVPKARLDECAGIIIECLVNTLSSRRGRWLLDKHQDAACELPVNGIVAGQLVHATIDRTFVESGVCWVVDYKTSAPAPGQDQQDFMNEEAERYRSQLQDYVELIRKLKRPEQVKAALYFPRFDGWKELEPEEN